MCRRLLSTQAYLPLALILSVIVASTARADSPRPGIAAPQYGGMVVDQTVSVAGQDFYRYFAAAWRENALSERFTLSIHEQASARWGSRVRIEYANRVMFQASLPIARPAIPAVARQAAQAVQQRIAEAEVDRLLFRDPDLGADEI